MTSQWNQGSLKNYPSQQRFIQNLSDDPQISQPLQPSYTSQQQNWQKQFQPANFQSPQQQINFQQFSDVQQPPLNLQQNQQSQQQQGRYPDLQKGGQQNYGYQFPQPQIDNNAVAPHSEKSYQKQNKSQLIRQAQYLLSPSSDVISQQQNSPFQPVKHQFKNLNMPTFRKIIQSPSQQQQQQYKPPINPDLIQPKNENKQLIPAQQIGRYQERSSANSQSTVIKSDEEELFKCQAKNCGKSFMRKKGDKMTKTCSDCKKIMERLVSPTVNLKCSQCPQPVSNSLITFQLCKECWKKKNEETQYKNTTNFQRVIFSGKKPPDKINQQTSKDISSLFSQSSNQQGSIIVVSPKRTVKDAQISQTLEKQTKDQLKEQSLMLQKTKVDVNIKLRDQKKLLEGNPESQNQDIIQQSHHKMRKSFQQSLQDKSSLNLPKQFQQQQQISQNFNKSASGQTFFRPPSYLALPKQYENNSQMNKATIVSASNEIKNNQLNNEQRYHINKLGGQQSQQVSNHQTHQPANGNQRQQFPLIQSANSLGRPPHNQARDYCQQLPSLRPVENNFNNNMTILNKQPQTISNKKSNQDQKSNQGGFIRKTPQLVGVNNQQFKTPVEQQEKQQFSFIQPNNQLLLSPQQNNLARKIIKPQTPSQNVEQNKALPTLNPQQYSPLNTQNSFNNLEQYPSANNYRRPLSRQQKEENQKQFYFTQPAQKRKLSTSNQDCSFTNYPSPYSSSKSQYSKKKPSCIYCLSAMPSSYQKQYWKCKCEQNPKCLENPFYVEAKQNINSGLNHEISSFRNYTLPDRSARQQNPINMPACSQCQSSMQSQFKEEFWKCNCSNSIFFQNPLYVEQS